MTQELTYHFHKVIKVINSCKTEEHLLGAKCLMINFANYWSYKIDNKTILVNYVKYLNVLFKHVQNDIIDYE
jgi:hypothetical protein